jgi:hypothetical protein
MGAGRHTVFFLLETSGDLAKSTNSESTHLGLSKMVVFALARAGGDLAAGCMGAGQGVPNSGEILRGRKLNFRWLINLPAARGSDALVILVYAGLWW